MDFWIGLASRSHEDTKTTKEWRRKAAGEAGQPAAAAVAACDASVSRISL
jgi:hypothetical protein